MNRYDRTVISTPRGFFAALFAVCAGLIAFALYLQHAQALEPCPMCILQRYAFVAIGLVALAGALHNPWNAMLKVYSSLIVLFAAAGAAIASWHSWLQHNPPPSTSCGTDLWYLLDSFPLASSLPAIFKGTGECSKVQWKLLGLSIPEWALVWFVIFAGVAIWAMVKLRRPRPN